jgi:hypothetical protein
MHEPYIDLSPVINFETERIGLAVNLMIYIRKVLGFKSLLGQDQS